MAALVQTIPIPADVSEWFSGEKFAAQRKWSWKKAAQNPAFVAVGIALAVIAGRIRI